MAVQLIADLYGCSEIINDTEAIKRTAHRAIEYVGADIVEECIHKFEPIGRYVHTVYSRALLVKLSSLLGSCNLLLVAHGLRCRTPEITGSIPGPL